MAWLERDLKSLKFLGTDLLPLGGFEAVREQAWDHLCRYLFKVDAPLPLREKVFTDCLQRAEEESRGLITRLQDRLAGLLAARREVALLLEQRQTKQAISYPGMRAQLEALAPADLLRRYDFDELPDLTRFLQAMMLRARRARESIGRDMEKAARVTPFETQLQELQKRAAKCKRPEAAKPFQLLLEEFKISVFAQEIGTRQKVSEKRLEQLRLQIESSLRQPGSPPR